MKLQCSTVVLVDETGRIVAIDPDVERLGIERGAVGALWSDAFDGWDVPPVPPDETVSLPFCDRFIAPTGEPVMLDLRRMPMGAGVSGYLAILRSEMGGTLSERQAQLCGLGEVSAGVAHEMNNALTLLIGWLDLLLAEASGNERMRSTLELLMNEATRISRLTRNLLEVARGVTEAPRECDVRALLDEVLTLVRYEMRASNIELESRVAQELPPIHGSPGRLKQALLNVLLNAQQAMPAGGRLVVSAEADPAGFVRLGIEDTGCGIPEEVRQRLFTPFFTTKENGTGLGLSVTRKIVEDHGGVVQIESEPGAGTRFTMTLPVHGTGRPSHGGRG